MSASEKIGPFRVTPHVRDGKPTGKWFVNSPKTIRGKRSRKLFEDRKSAIDAARQLHKKLLNGEIHRQAEQQTLVGTMTFFEAIRLWLEVQALRVRTGKKRQSSLDRDNHHFVSAKTFLGDVPLTSITAKRIAEYQADRKDKGIKPVTINTDVVAIFKVLRWALQDGHLHKLPICERLPIPKKAPEVPNMAEVARIVRALPANVRVLGRLLAETGCRRGEAFNLRWDDVDLRNGIVHIRSKEGWTPKTSHSERSLPIGAGLLQQLKRLAKRETSEFVFPGTDPKKPRAYIRRVFRTAVQKAKVMRNGKPLRITPHTLRKAYATWAAIEKGLPPRLLQAILGHAPGSTVTDQWYVGVPASALRKGVNELRL